MDSTGTRISNKTSGDKKPAVEPKRTTGQPEFRSATRLAPESDKLKEKSPVPKKASFYTTNAIHKEEYINVKKAAEIAAPIDESNWSPTQVRFVPPYYPLERSNRLVEFSLETVARRIAEANRILSIHAIYDNKNATATLLTSENVEMHLSLWKTSAKTGESANPEGIVVEVQRRKGDSIAFHRYSRLILDVAAGDIETNIDVAAGDNETNKVAKLKGDYLDVLYSRNVQRLSDPKDSEAEYENAIIAVEIAHGLIMKDRIDARQLGLESLCLLTDPKKTGVATALIASRVVLLGSLQDIASSSSAPEEGLMVDETPFQEIRQTLLSLIQFKRIGDDELFEGDEPEHITVLHNLALAVLANALDVIADDGIHEQASSSEEGTVGRSRLDTSESISEKFLEDSLECSNNHEIMKTLISELGKASTKPHNACLSAKCLNSVCRASVKARKRAEDLGAKQVVESALKVGTKTHLKLEQECGKVLTTLSSANSNE